MSELVYRNNAYAKQQLSKRQKVVIAYIVASPNLHQACRDANIGRTTVYEWLKIPEFKAELERQRNELVAFSAGELKGALGKAIEKMVSLLDSPNEETARKTANDIIKYNFKLGEYEDIVRKLKKTEKLILERKTYVEDPWEEYRRKMVKDYNQPKHDDPEEQEQDVSNPEPEAEPEPALEQEKEEEFEEEQENGGGYYG